MRNLPIVLFIIIILTSVIHYSCSIKCDDEEDYKSDKKETLLQKKDTLASSKID